MGLGKLPDLENLFFSNHRLKSLNPRDTCPDLVQSLIDPLISPVDLVYIMDRAGTLGAHSGDQQGDTRANIRGYHRRAP